MIPVDPQTAIMAIKGCKELIEKSPVIINAANHIVKNGIKEGGYDVITAAWNGIANNSGTVSSIKEVGQTALQGLKDNFVSDSGNVCSDVITLGKNIKERFIPNSPTNTQKLNNTDAFKATDKFSHATSQAIGSAAFKGGIVGIAIGITTETLASYERYKKGELDKKEYVTEIAKSGAQMGINGATAAGIMVPVKVALTAVGASNPVVTVPVSIILGTAIDKVVAPAFGRGDYKKILDEAKYYQNIMYAHDDLVSAIEATENQFVDFIDEYQKQMMIHSKLTDTNSQLKQLHKAADNQLNQQNSQLNNTFGALGNLYNKI